MDKDVNGLKNEPFIITLDSPKAMEDVEENGEDYSEFKALLPPRKGGMSRTSDKVSRKVQWNDNNGNKLVEVLEFEPSDDSDSEEEDKDSCLCTIM
ncbi:hypothetical protein SADUNF_Sadunf10G0041100 [Salix dunnii]|uniref:Uncharacterized protein n=1 Tax=Salix dunnii TaxID=1413687 RepID=A0A835JQ85_9ROSI|nr:hypothetical protein SADUNF_Sadunf10G0041100 [Salix dunnii]